MNYSASESVSKLEEMINNSKISYNDNDNNYESFDTNENRAIEVDYKSLKYCMKNHELYVSARFKFLLNESLMRELEESSDLFFEGLGDYRLMLFNDDWKESNTKETENNDEVNIDSNNIIEFSNTLSDEEDYEILKQLL